ncbi:MAG: hypothetical protein RBS39_03905 [Phycisphaerales bacterium]|jgi:hypothetical protein|nr:hypothetical protein [Phycisphaerales bacterium]
MSDEHVRIMCPNLVCRKVLSVPHETRGKTVRCRACGTMIRVPPGVTSAPSKAGPSKSEGSSAPAPAKSPPKPNAA